jgi:predicted metallopeptidase
MALVTHTIDISLYAPKLLSQAYYDIANTCLYLTDLLRNKFYRMSQVARQKIIRKEPTHIPVRTALSVLRNNGGISTFRMNRLKEVKHC